MSDMSQSSEEIYNACAQEALNLIYFSKDPANTDMLSCLIASGKLAERILAFGDSRFDDGVAAGVTGALKATGSI
jgi:hypothetical protein